MDEGVSVDEVSLSLSLKRLHGGSLGGGAPSLGTLEDMLRKSLDVGISLHGHFPAEGNLVCGSTYAGDFTG